MGGSSTLTIEHNTFHSDGTAVTNGIAVIV